MFIFRSVYCIPIYVKHQKTANTKQTSRQNFTMFKPAVCFSCQGPVHELTLARKFMQNWCNRLESFCNPHLANKINSTSSNLLQNRLFWKQEETPHSRNSKKITTHPIIAHPIGNPPFANYERNPIVACWERFRGVFQFGVLKQP